MSILSLNNRPIDRSSLEIEGVDRSDYPDFVDTFFSFARFHQGRKLTDEELQQLTENEGELLNEMAINSLF